jgi:hypothetical protein
MAEQVTCCPACSTVVVLRIVTLTNRPCEFVGAQVSVAHMLSLHTDE